MSDMLGIGSSGISVYQRALATVSNNIANVSTEGYSRQDAIIGANAPRRVGTNYLGNGAVFNGVRRQYDAFIESNLRNSKSDLQSQEPLVKYVNRLIDIMGDESIGLTSALNRFFDAGRMLASDPASPVQRSTFLRDADGLAARFRQLSSQFELLDTETRQAVQNDVGQINSYTAQLAELNKQMTKHASADKQPAELLDQRDMLLRKLAEFTAVKTRIAENGAVLVTVGDVESQGVLVDGNKFFSIGLAEPSVAEPDKVQFVLDPYGSPKALPNLLSGSIGGTLSFRDQVLFVASEALNDLAKTLVREVNTAHRGGIDIEGRLGTDLFSIASHPRGSAAGIALTQTDASRVAAAGQFRITDNPLNTSQVQAMITWSEPAYPGPSGLYASLSEGLWPQLPREALTFNDARTVAPLGIAAQGMKDLVVTLQRPQSGQSLQVITRDGRHLLGTALSSEQRQQMVRTASGSEAGATYDATALNQPYLDMDLYLGARGIVQMVQRFDPETRTVVGLVPTPAVLSGRSISDLTGPIAEGTFTLNGRTLGVLDTEGPLTAQQVADWLNTYTQADGDLPGTGVTATVTDDGALRLARLASNVTDDIRLGVGPSGTAADLDRLGFDVAVHMNGVMQDDLMVFVTDSSGLTRQDVTVTSQFAGQGGDMKQALRAQALQVEFTSATTYRISERRTGTLLAERTYDPVAATIGYRGLTISLSASPNEGDTFDIDGNDDGIGNNEAMMVLVSLEDRRIMSGGLTMTEAYIERVNQVGNMAQQASISMDALRVVYDQAAEARDGIAGVSLDEEAASLVRLQQAYQANARVMQAANDLFDTILNVR